MLALMTLELQKQHKDMDPPSILLHLHEMFTTCAIYERYQVPTTLYWCKMDGEDQVDPHVVGALRG